MQKKYWAFLFQIKWALEYMNLIYERAYKRDRGISIVIALVSGVTIAAWKIWQKLGTTWAIILGMGQALAIIKPFLSCGVLIEHLPTTCSDISNLFAKCEKSWFDVSGGKLSESEINDLLFEYKEQFNLIDNTARVKCKAIPSSKKLIAQADKCMTSYFELNY